MIRHPAFLSVYNLFPHRILNAGCAFLTRRRWPRPVLRRIIARWERRGEADPSDFEPAEHATLEQWFLRRLKPGKRPLADGFVSPVDGIVVGAGRTDSDTILQVKGRPTSLSVMVNGRNGHEIDTTRYKGGEYVTIFLTPDGYHHLHAPTDAALKQCHYRSGRFFPQNPTALRYVDSVYERNERAVLEFDAPTCGEFLLVMVGASMIGAIFVCGESAFQFRGDGRQLAKGDKLAHFTFGSTIVLVMPPGMPERRVDIGQRVRVGERIF